MAVVTILALGGHFVVLGNMTLGNFAAFNSYLFLLIFPILMIGFMSNIIASHQHHIQRIHDILEATDVKDDGTIKADIKGDIKMQDISLLL